MGLINSFRDWIFPLKYNDREQIWKAFGSFQSNQFAMSGNNLIKNSYEKNVDVFAVIKKIVDISKSLDWIVEEKKGNEWVLLENTSLHELIYSPNKTKGYTWNDIEEQLLVYLLTSGNSYLVGNTQLNSSLIEEVDVIPSNSVCIEVLNKDYFLPIINYEFYFDNKEYNFSKEQLAHIKFFNPSYTTLQESLYGLSPIQVAAKVVQTGNDRWDADANLLQNRGAIGMITDKSNRPMLPDEAAKVQSDFDKQTAGTRNFGKIKVTNKDLAYIQMAMSSVDLQLIEKGVVNLRAICNVFGLDSSLFNDPENKTYNSRREAEKSMYTNTIMPLSDKLSEALTLFLCLNHFPNRNVRMRQDFSKIEVLQENFKEKAEVYNMLKNSGIVSANTAAKALRQPLSEDDNANELTIANSNVLLETLGGKKDNESLQLEILRGMSPLVANKIIESLDTNEIRSLLGLAPKTTTNETTNI
jgi:HK97 family phage portal protein